MPELLYESIVIKGGEKMKKLGLLLGLIFSIVLFTGCFKTMSVTYTSPVNGATEVQINVVIIWTAKNATVFDVYFGTEANPPLLSPNQMAMTYSPAALNPGTTYHWKVVAKDGDKQKEGPLWSFTTGSAPSNLNYTGPANNSTDRPLDTTLAWTCTGATSYDVYFGTNATPPLVSAGQAGSSYSPGPLAPGTTYHWKVIAKNAFGELAGATWKFTTMLVIPDGISISRAVLQKNSDEEIFVHGKNIDNIGGCSLIITYDSTYLEIDTNKGNNGVVALNSFNGGLIIVDATTAGTLKIDIAFMSAKNISDEDIFKIHIKTMNKTGDTQINITGQVLDPSTNPIAVVFTGNTITVE